MVLVNNHSGLKPTICLDRLWMSFNKDFRLG
ncbi:MAG: hypothetical protein ACJA0G_001471 [Kangiellaceae bacterium]